MGGASSEVSETTTDILLEAAHFDPITVARSSRRHRLMTEGSKRWERGVDNRMQPQVAQLAVDLLVRYGGGTADPGVTDVDLTKPHEAYRLDVTEPSRLVGVDYSRERVLEILRDLGCTVDESGPGADDRHVLVTPPSWRPDLVDGPDYAEEVARIDGYERIPSVNPTPTAGHGLTHGQRVRRIVANALAGRGLVEVLTYPFVSPDVANAFGLPTDDERRYAVRIVNPLSDEAPLMRTSILATLVEALRRNVSRGRKDVGLFELGVVTLPGAQATHTAPVPGIDRRPDDETIAAIERAVPPQPRHVAAVIAGDAERAGWWGPGRPASWEDGVESVLAIGKALAVPLVVSPVTDHAPWHPGRCALISLMGQGADVGALVGYAGELHPKTIAALDLPPRTVAFELDVDVLSEASALATRYHEISTYPVAFTDVALVVDAAVTAAEVERALRGGAGDDLEEVLLFDVYSGEQIGDGKASLAYRLTFRAPDRTLTTEEVNEFRDAAVRAAARAVGAVQRV
jgi:phenylalanyl-tRNA synthetase beta chain